MPARTSRRDDPQFRDIDRWNDGVENVDPNEFEPGVTRPPYYPPAQEWPKSTKTAKYIPQSLPDRREEHHERTRPRPPTPEPSHARHARYRSPSPRPSRDHQSRHHHRRPHDSHSHREATDGPHARRPPIASSKTAPAPSTTTSRRHRGRSVSPSRHGNPRSDPKARPSVQRSKTTSINYNELLSHPRFQTAAVAALEAGSATAFKLRRAPGSWSGDKAARVAGAAIGAAALGAFKGSPAPKEEAGRRASEKPRSGGRAGPPSSANVGSALGGMLADQLASRRGGSSRKKGRR